MLNIKPSLMDPFFHFISEKILHKNIFNIQIYRSNLLQPSDFKTAKNPL